MDCQRCNGSGEQSCRHCEEAGHHHVGRDCPDCAGEGYIPCGYCGGSGSLE